MESIEASLLRITESKEFQARDRMKARGSSIFIVCREASQVGCCQEAGKRVETGRSVGCCACDLPMGFFELASRHALRSRNVAHALTVLSLRVWSPCWLQ